MLSIQEIASHFDHVKWEGRGFTCECPVCCGKGKRELSINPNKTNDRILINPFCGCDTKDIIDAVGLEWSDLTAKEYKRPDWMSRAEWYMQNSAPNGSRKGYGESMKLKAVYTYRTAQGDYIYTKVRFQDEKTGEKQLRYYIVDELLDEITKFGKDDRTAELYRLPELIKAVKDGKTVYIVEGEKDVETLRKLGRTATTGGGVMDWRKVYARFFKGARVIILRDNDEPGEKLADQIAKDLRQYAFTVTTVNPSNIPKGDITDYLEKENGTIEKLDEMTAAAAESAQYASWVNVQRDSKGSVKRVSINGDLLAETFRRNESYIITRSGSDDKDDIYIYRDGYYQRANKSALKAAIREYIPSGYATDTLLNNIVGLILADNSHVVRAEELDSNERYINLRNGLYDVTENKIIPHSPDQLYTRQLNVCYEPGRTYGKDNFTKYINDLCRSLETEEVDPDRQAIIQEFLGLVLTNQPVHRVKKALILWSAQGNSGKSTILRILTELLGTEYTTSVTLQAMDESGFNRFALGNIARKRLIVIGDASDMTVKSSTVFKKLTGGDYLESESKGRQQQTIIFSGGIVMAANGLPYFQDDQGKHVFARMQIVPCEHTIPDEEKDALLEQRIIAEELPAVFGWLMEGARRLIKNRYRLTPSAISAEVLEEHRKMFDPLYRYVSEYYIITGVRTDTISKAQFLKDYDSYCFESATVQISRAKLDYRLESIGVHKNPKGNTKTQRGIAVYYGIKPKPIADIFD